MDDFHPCDPSLLQDREQAFLLPYKFPHGPSQAITILVFFALGICFACSTISCKRKLIMMTSHVKFIHLVTCIGSLFLFIRSSFPLYGCDTACLPILLWSVSSFWLWMFLHKPFCGHNVFISLGSVPRSGIAGSKEAVTSCSWNDALCSVVEIVSIRQPLVAHLHCSFTLSIPLRASAWVFLG